MKCPICGSELKLVSEYKDECGLVESHHTCDNCKLYGEDFLYGETSIGIGAFSTGYRHDISDDCRKQLFAEIDAVCKALRELYHIAGPTVEPLSIEELSQMGSKPYYHVSLQDNGSHWAILPIHIAKNLKDYHYGERWLAYQFELNFNPNLKNTNKE